MKALASVVVVLMAPCVILAQTHQGRFDVAGYGRVFYEPDAYDISFGISTLDADVQQCKERHLAAVQQVSKFLDANKEKMFSLKKDATLLRPWFPPRDERKFCFTTAYTARIKDPKSLLTLQEGLITSGVTEIYGVDMFSESLPRLVEQARKEAIKDAKAKAELAAAELGWSLQGALGITMQDGEMYRWHHVQHASQNYGSRSYDYDRGQIPESTNVITCQVNISFSFDSSPDKTARTVRPESHESSDSG